MHHTGNVGGAVFSSNSQIRFDCNSTIVGNEVGSAIYIQSSLVSLMGYFNIYDNN